RAFVRGAHRVVAGRRHAGTAGAHGTGLRGADHEPCARRGFPQGGPSAIDSVSMARIVLCDLDGTLSDTRHRERFVTQDPPDYDSFYAAAGGDAPIRPVIEVVNALASAGFEIHITTGRRDDTRAVTERWLADNGVTYHRLVMREYHDLTPDDELKKRWYEAEYKDLDVLCVLEDRNRVVKMWRELGLVCLHVADADF